METQVITAIENDKPEIARQLLSDRDMAYLLDSLVPVLSSVSDQMVDAAKDLYISAITEQAKLDMRVLESKEKVIERYNDQVDTLLLNLDKNNERTVNSVVEILKQIGENLEKQLDSFSPKASLFGRIFGRRG